MSLKLEKAPVQWGDLVFHVLAHVPPARRVAASVYDKVYVDFVKKHAGPASGRTLAEDAQALGKLAVTHEELASVQQLAWLHETIKSAQAAARWELRELGPEQVDAPEVLSGLVRTAPAAELLRRAALLEEQVWASLPAEVDGRALQQAFEIVMPTAPWLHRCRVRLVRSLRLRGRVRGNEIWVGMPMVALDLGSEHVAWQAAHEATVREASVMARKNGMSATYGLVEPVAVVALASRSKRAGLQHEHGNWYGHLARPPSIHPEPLLPEQRHLLTQMLE